MEKYKIWDRLISILSELDCLCALSIVSFYSCEGVMTRPEISNFTENPFINFKGARHPCICLTGVNFIPNDIFIQDKNILLITGPNMGGKSTTLRMACLLIIIAQVLIIIFLFIIYQ